MLINIALSLLIIFVSISFLLDVSKCFFLGKLFVYLYKAKEILFLMWIFSLIIYVYILLKLKKLILMFFSYILFTFVFLVYFLAAVHIIVRNLIVNF